MADDPMNVEPDYTDFDQCWQHPRTQRVLNAQVNAATMPRDDRGLIPPASRWTESSRTHPGYVAVTRIEKFINSVNRQVSASQDVRAGEP